MRIPPHHRRAPAAARRCRTRSRSRVGTGLVLAGASIHVDLLRRCRSRSRAARSRSLRSSVSSRAARCASRPDFPPRSRCAGLLMFAFFGTEAYVPLALTDIRHTSSTVAGHRADDGHAHVDRGRVGAGADGRALGPARARPGRVRPAACSASRRARSRCRAGPGRGLRRLLGRRRASGVGLVFSPLTLTVLALRPRGARKGRRRRRSSCRVCSASRSAPASAARWSRSRRRSTGAERRGVLSVDIVTGAIALVAFVASDATASTRPAAPATEPAQSRSSAEA